jgi:hypothetical protein
MQDWLIAVGIHRKSKKPALRDGFPFSGQARSNTPLALPQIITCLPR